MYNNNIVLECLWFCIELYHWSDKSQAWNLYEQTLDPLAIVRLITFMHVWYTYAWCIVRAVHDTRVYMTAILRAESKLHE